MQPAGWRHDEPIGEQPRQLEAPAVCLRERSTTRLSV
jgi:hypothetical protein